MALANTIKRSETASEVAPEKGASVYNGEELASLLFLLHSFVCIVAG